MLPIGVQTGGLEGFYGEEEAYRLIKEAGFDAADANIDHLMTWGDVVNKRLPSWFEDGHEKELLEKLTPWKDGAKKIWRGQLSGPCAPAQLSDAGSRGSL